MVEMTLHTFKRQLSVPHLMCRRTEGTSTTARRCCGVGRDSGAGYKTADLLTYLDTGVVYDIEVFIAELK